mmetsp:Transcript_48422/g.126567  ORF Transcript_48422/g.126567 Transcript_48422/m.126567 type:complete len:238 (-) Transcript_48422:854-1567(-)
MRFATCMSRPVHTRKALFLHLDLGSLSFFSCGRGFHLVGIPAQLRTDAYVQSPTQKPGSDRTVDSFRSRFGHSFIMAWHHVLIAQHARRPRLPKDIAQEFHREAGTRKARAPEHRPDGLKHLHWRVVDPEEGAHILLGVISLEAAIATIKAHEDAGEDREVTERVDQTIFPKARHPILLVHPHRVIGHREGDGEAAPPTKRAEVAVNHCMQRPKVKVDFLEHRERLQQVVVSHELSA